MGATSTSVSLAVLGPFALAEEATRAFLGLEAPAQASQGQQQRPAEGYGGVAVLPVFGALSRRPVSGWTVSYIQLEEQLRALVADAGARAIVLRFDSPGGDLGGGPELAAQIRAWSKKKPIVAFADGSCLSAAYWLASACSSVVASPTAVLGAIGVRFLISDDSASRTLREGVRDLELVSSFTPAKRELSATGGIADSLVSELQSRADLLGREFLDQVANYRGIDFETATAKFGKGQVYVGRLAVEAGLADRLGTLASTIEELMTQEREEAAPAPSAGGGESVRAQTDSGPLERLYAALVELTGRQDVEEILGAVEGFRASAQRAVVGLELLQKQQLIEQAIADGQIAPHQREHYLRLPLARLRAFVETAAKDPPQFVPSKGEPLTREAPMAAAITPEVEAEVRKLLGRGGSHAGPR